MIAKLARIVLLAQEDVAGNQAFVTTLNVLFFGLLIAFVLLALRISIGNDSARALRRLVGLSVGAAILWIISAFVVSYYVLLSRPSDIPARSDGYVATFGIPVEWHIVARLTGSHYTEISPWWNTIITTVTVALILFALALLVFALSQPLKALLRPGQVRIG